jgi:hypothetical protein
MYNINYFITRIFIFFIFTILPFLFGILLFLVIKLFEPTYYCDGNTMEDLKSKLNDEIVQYNQTLKELDKIVDKMDINEQYKKCN